jgi:hypothetical protein
VAVNKREFQYAILWAAAVMLLTCVPYLVVWWYTPRDGVFPLTLFNSDDHGVYFAWMRQARDGHLLFRNLFTTEPQRGIYLQLYFLLLGGLARVSGMDIPLAYHLGRVGFGTLALVLAYRLAAFFTPDLFTRRCVFWTTALSAGVGWLYWSNSISTYEPVDVWQPEALTFPSLYANGLFCASLALILGVVICLLLAEERGWPWAVGAGLCGLLLGNVHSYDVIHLALAWAAYLMGRWAVERRFPARATGLALLAAAVASPSVAYMAWLYKTEPVFKARADTPTLSHGPWLYLGGYGLLVPLALWGGILLRRHEEGGENAEEDGRRWRRALLVTAALVATGSLLYAAEGVYRNLIFLVPLAGWAVVSGRWSMVNGQSAVGSRQQSVEGSGADPEARPDPAVPHSAIRTPHSALGAPLLLPLAWCCAALAAAYLPCAFQRKMIMGFHFPLSLLAGVALADLARRAAKRFPAPRRASVAAALVLAVLCISNLRYLYRDPERALLKNETSTGVHPAYWLASEIHAFTWLGEHTPEGAALLAFPLNGVLAPAYSGRSVYAGHWGETPDFAGRVREVRGFYQGRQGTAEQLRFLKTRGLTHVFVSPNERLLIAQGEERYGTPSLERAPFLKRVFQDGETALYEVR